MGLEVVGAFFHAAKRQLDGLFVTAQVAHGEGDLASVGETRPASSSSGTRSSTGWKRSTFSRHRLSDRSTSSSERIRSSSFLRRSGPTDSDANRSRKAASSSVREGLTGCIFSASPAAGWATTVALRFSAMTGPPFLLRQPRSRRPAGRWPVQPAGGRGWPSFRKSIRHRGRLFQRARSAREASNRL